MNHGDTFDIEPVVIRKKKVKSMVHRSKQASHQSKIEQSEIGKVDIIPRETAQILQKGRTAKGISQKQLAQQLNIPLKTIQAIENGKAPKNRALWQRVARFLGVKI